MSVITKSKDVDTIHVDELVGYLQTYEYDLPKTNKSKSMALETVDDVDDNVFNNEISSTKIAYLAKQFRNFLKNNNKKARNKNFVDYKNVKKNEQPKNDFPKKSTSKKEKVGKFSNNSLSQQFFCCQGFGHIKSKCPTYLRSKEKAMAITLNDDEGFDHGSNNDQEGKFMAFTATAMIDETTDEKGESSSNEELYENDNLQETYNKLCKIAVKDAITVEVSLKKIDTLEIEKKNLLIKLFDTNELLNVVKIENMSLVEKVKELESVLSVTREQLGRSSSSKLDEMLGTQKYSCDKIGLGYVEDDYVSKNSSTKFVISAPVSFPKSKERVHKKEILATRRIKVDLSDTKPK